MSVEQLALVPKPLNQTHDWMGWQHHTRIEGNLFRLSALPVCRRCWVEGYEDVREAFTDCPGHVCWPGHAHPTAPSASAGSVDS